MHVGRFSSEVRVLLGNFEDFSFSDISEMTDGGVRLFLDFIAREIFWLPQSETDSVRIYLSDGSSNIFLADGARLFTHAVTDESDIETEFQDPIDDIDYLE